MAKGGGRVLVGEGSVWFFFLCFQVKTPALVICSVIATNYVQL